MKRTMAGLVGTVTAVVLSWPAIAHHSTSAVFDRNDQVTVSGTVTEVQWMNPHIWFFVDAEDGSGGVANWAFEMTNPNALIRLGWRPNSLNVGDVVTVVASRARDMSNRAAVRTVKLSTGRELFGGQNFEAE